MRWSTVVACLILGATIFGCLAIEPAGSIIMVILYGFWRMMKSLIEESR